MNVTINGKTADLPPSCTVMDYLLKNGIRPETVAVEHNLNVLDKGEYARTPLAEGDSVEIVKFVGGGSI